MRWTQWILYLYFFSFALIAFEPSFAQHPASEFESPEHYTDQLRLPYKKNVKKPSTPKSFLDDFNPSPVVRENPGNKINNQKTNPTTQLPSPALTNPQTVIERMPAQALNPIEEAMKKVYKIYLYKPGSQSPFMQATAVALGQFQIFSTYGIIAPIIHTDPKIRAFVLNQGQLVEVQVQAVDVINNLALLSAKNPLSFSFQETEVKTEAVTNGEKLRLIALKSNEPASFVEVTNLESFTDGLVQYNKLDAVLDPHYFGGALIDKGGQLAGILRGTHFQDPRRFGAMNSVYFLKFLLSQRPVDGVYNLQQLKQKVQKQLNHFQEKVAQNLTSIEASGNHLKTSGWASGPLSKNITCQTQQIQKTPTLAAHLSNYTKLHCENKLSIVLADDIKVGHIIATASVTTPNSDADLDLSVRYKVSLELAQDLIAGYSKTVNTKLYTKSNCQQIKILNSHGLPVTLHFCTATMKDHPNLNTTMVRMISLNPESNWLQLNLLLEGFDQKNSTQIMKSFADEIRRAP